MRAFVTGATGLLGNNLVRLLLSEGHEVVALVRSRAKAAQQFPGLPLTLVEGDMKNVAAFAPAMAGCEVVFHTAAYFRESFQPGEHDDQLKAINVDGSIKLLEAAEQQGVRRVIYTSSSGVIGMRPGEEWGDETTPPDAHTYANPYFHSKVLAEAEIARFLERSALEVVLILPGWMFGPGDAAPTGSGEVILSLINRTLPGMIPGGGAPVDARDVAQAMLNAVSRGISGERYIVGGDRFVSFREIADTFQQVSGLPAPQLDIPRPVAYMIALGSEIAARITGKPALITRQALRTLGARRTTRSSKAIRELGATFRPFAETLRDEVAWFQQQRAPGTTSERAAHAVSR
jgi:dihydroflavonol-4-reductase